MKRPKLTPEESLRRIKLMMNYDISRSLNEQTKSPWDIAKRTGEIAGGAAALGAGTGALKTAALKSAGNVGAGVAGLKAGKKFGPKIIKAIGSLFTKGTAAAAEGVDAAIASGVGSTVARTGVITGLGQGFVSTSTLPGALVGGETAALAGGVGTEAAVAGGIGAGAIGGAILAGAAALAVVPLVLWLVDKDQAYPKVKKLFDYVKANKDKIDKIPRGLDDEVIQALSDDAYNAMKGLGTNKKLLFSVFDSLVTISDFSALITTFSEDYLSEGHGDLLEWLDDDIDISSTWNRIYAPLRNIVKKFAKQLADENPESAPHVDTTSVDIYKPCTGTYSFGCESETIKKIQGCLGGLIEDGKFGPKTQVKLGQLKKGYDKQFTDADVQTICSLAPSLIQRVKPLPTAPVSNLQMSNLVPKLDTTTLRPASTQSVSPERIKEIQDNIRRNKKYVGPPLNDAETAWLNDYMQKLTGKTPQVGTQRVRFTNPTTT